MNYKQAVDYFSEIPKFADKKHDPEDLRAFLEEMGNPQEQLKLIHVAGTNGKGSVCAFLTSLLIQAGYETATFVSPHLVTVNERFMINGQPTDDDSFLNAFKNVCQVVDKLKARGITHPTFFEFAFLLFMAVCQEKMTEYAVLETGMGGRLDATNVVRNPLVTVITSISMDHVEYLGDTIEKIAAEKAGIIKPGVPVICDGSDERALKVIVEKAQASGSSYISVSARDCQIDMISKDGTAITCLTESTMGQKLNIPFFAEYQAVNCMMAVTAFMQLFSQPPDWKLVEDGISKAKWPGRMEQVLDGVYLDGAHNEGGVRAFVTAAGRIARETKGKIYLLIAVASDKDYEAMVGTICKEILFDGLIVTQVNSKRALDADILEHAAEKFTSRPVYEYDTVSESIDRAFEMKGEQDILFCVGSLYLIGEIKGILEEKQL